MNMFNSQNQNVIQYILGIQHLLCYPDQMKRHILNDATPGVSPSWYVSTALNWNEYAIYTNTR